MKILASLIVVAALFGCATPRTKYTDAVMRLMIDPDSISPEHYDRIQSALVETGKFTVVDRAAGFAAAQKEQERLHRDQPKRYDDKEKWAMWGRLLGVGGIAVAKAQCHKEPSWVQGKVYLRCLQMLSIIDASTGEVIVAVESNNDGSSVVDNVTTYPPVPDWKDAVQLLVEKYPEKFEDREYHSRLKKYQKQSEENARVPATDR